MEAWHEKLLQGQVIPAHPLALTGVRKLDERRQRALSRYYLAAGAGGLAVGVHTTQFAIHDPAVGLYAPVLSLAAEEVARSGRSDVVMVAGLIGKTEQAVSEATLARDLGYHAGLLSLSAWRGARDDQLLAHCRAVADVLPVFGFYLQPAVGGIELSHEFWCQFVQMPNVVAIKVAAFDRYRTMDVVRAVALSGRADIGLYTGNDDNIVLDLITPYRVLTAQGATEQRYVGGLLGQWAVGTRRAVELLRACHACVSSGHAGADLLVRANELTDVNSALFDAAHRFAGCIAGIQEALRLDGLLESNLCWDDDQRLSPGQAEEIARVRREYPQLFDDRFVAEYRDQWLSG